MRETLRPLAPRLTYCTTLVRGHLSKPEDTADASDVIRALQRIAEKLVRNCSEALAHAVQPLVHFPVWVCRGEGPPELLDLRPQCVHGRSTGTDTREITFELLDKMRHLFEIDAGRSAIRRR